MILQELEELENLASKADALLTVILHSCEKEGYITQQIVLEETRKITEEMSNRLIELCFRN